jgi:hypothetical protein
MKEGVGGRAVAPPQHSACLLSSPYPSALGVPTLTPHSARPPQPGLGLAASPLSYIRGGEEVQYRLAASVIGKEGGPVL